MGYIGKEVLKKMVVAKNYNRYLTDFCIKKLSPNNDIIVDLGAGTGTISSYLREKGYKLECVECDESLAENLTKLGFKTCTNINDYEDNSISQIISLNVLEHVKDDENFLNEVFKKLKSGGRFLLFVPAYSCLYSSFDKGLGHFRRYNCEELTRMVKNCGFKIENKEYFDSLGWICAYIYKIFNKTGKISTFSVKVFDKFLFPLSILMDKSCNSHFGKNISLTLTKE